ncbi:MAG TPA: chemotaxis protein CheA [Clostridia bacterium]|mgnify:CR=1 FL=1|nr:chemotaxis protein CheA [Clostridia bacterium]
MGDMFSNEPMVDVFIYETEQNLEQLETAILAIEESGCIVADIINEIFRAMHTIKGSAAMMMYDCIAQLAHAMEDLFYYIREEKPKNIDCCILSDYALEGVDFIKLELEKVKAALKLDGDPSVLIERINSYLLEIKGENGALSKAEPKTTPKAEHYYVASARSVSKNLKEYEATIFFEDGCEMENMRAFSIIHNLKDITEEFYHFPEDIIENSNSVAVIREDGFKIILRTERSLIELHEFFSKTAFVRDLELHELKGQETAQEAFGKDADSQLGLKRLDSRAEQLLAESRGQHQSIISVDVGKLDRLMELMGEMVIAEAMVTENPELKDLKLNSFYKASRQLRKITDEMQDIVMSIRMVPLSASFHKMRRLVRDMSRKLGKEVELVLLGEETEVDKNIIEHISDPLMHLVRNAVDHGIEAPKGRTAAGKPSAGTIILEAKNAGNDVLISVRDDGAGIDKAKTLKKAAALGLINKPESELSDKEIYSLIFTPGFSNNEQVTEYSGRGVGMDVVAKNIELIGGSVAVESVEGKGTVTTLKIPLTLAIIDGMSIRVGQAKYTLPTASIKETFRPKAADLIKDPEGNEMILVRGKCFSIMRLHERFVLEPDEHELTKGIMLMVEQDDKCVCLFADELLGQHQVVVKSLPEYLKSVKRIDDLAGCTLLGDGSISLILNIGGLLSS